MTLVLHYHGAFFPIFFSFYVTHTIGVFLRNFTLFVRLFCLVRWIYAKTKLKEDVRLFQCTCHHLRHVQRAFPPDPTLSFLPFFFNSNFTSFALLYVGVPEICGSFFHSSSLKYCAIERCRRCDRFRQIGKVRSSESSVHMWCVIYLLICVARNKIWVTRHVSAETVFKFSNMAIWYSCSRLIERWDFRLENWRLSS